MISKTVRRMLAVSLAAVMAVGAMAQKPIDVGFHLGYEFVLRNGAYYQRSLFDKSDGAVLQLTGGVGLGVEVGDLLQLQRTLHAGSIVQVAADEEDRVAVEGAGGEGLDGLGVLQDALGLCLRSTYADRIPRRFYPWRCDLWSFL